MKNSLTISIIGYLFVLITINVALHWSHAPIGNTTLTWAMNFPMIFFCIKYAVNNDLLFDRHYFLGTIFLIWAIIGAIRGTWYVNNYWIAKQFFTGIMSVSLPCFIYVFSSPIATINVLRIWNKWIFPFFIFLFSWFTRNGTLHFYLGPVYCLYGNFVHWLPKKVKYLVIFIVIFMLVANIGARSQVIKAVICFLMAVLIYFNKYIPIVIVKIGSISMYVTAIVLLYLGISGTYNIFDHKDHDTDKRPTVFVDGEIEKSQEVSENLADTRTFIYIEVITSAINNDYVIMGRTLARGNDSVYFGKNSLTGENERYRNELCHLNIFTWLGILGVILYSLIYLYASILAAFFSKNVYIIYLGALVGFHWLYGWVEDMNDFGPMNIALWMIIGMCLSPKFRKMSNSEFIIWFKSIFSEGEILPYTVFNTLKVKLLSISLNSHRNNPSK